MNNFRFDFSRAMDYAIGISCGLVAAMTITIAMVILINMVFGQ